jgi:hypothetical protein
MGWVKGEPRKFCKGHNSKGVSGDKHNCWKGGRIIQSGYIQVNQPEHHRASSSGYVYEHTLVAEKALGKSLPFGAVVHHIDSNRQNNNPSNLVICQNHSYHRLLHCRMKVRERI